MDQKTLNFQSQNLVVDYLTFKFQELHCDQNKIANYLLDLGFNSYKQSGKLVKPIKENIFVNDNNKFAVLFVNDNSYWKGTSLHFTGKNSAYFYSLAKQNIIDWQIFEKAKLGRFDLNYSRKNKGDKISSTDFMERCHKAVQKTERNVTLQKNSKGSILKIGNRASNHYFRIYENNDFLKFEYEMKGKFLLNIHELLFSNNFEEIEFYLTKEFLNKFGKLLPLQYSYLDWLIIKLRPVKNQTHYQLGFNSDYIEPGINIKEESLIMFIQFLNYAQTLDYTINDWDHSGPAILQ